MIIKNSPSTKKSNHAKDKDQFVKKLGEKKIWIRVLEDPKWFRACVHQMTTEAEIDLLSMEIKKIIN